MPQEALTKEHHKSAQAGKCRICGRILTDPVSVAAGVGPVCGGGIGGAGVRKTQEQSQLEFDGDIILRRTPNGIITNVPHSWVLHSPTGFEWGYGGSGPAELALNILLMFTDKDVADRLHQNFKRVFIASMPPEGGTIKQDAILSWLKSHGADARPASV